MDYKDILKKLQEYYANLLIVQYNSKPKAKATIEKLTGLIYANMILLQIQNAFDWRTAKGKQLDIIGQWVGVSRSYTINLITKNKLAYLQYSKLVPRVINSALQGGYSNYETFGDNDGGQLRYNDLQSVSNELNDDAYRVIIGLKIIYNNINHTAGEIDKAIWEYFGGAVYTAWDMVNNPQEIIYYYPESYAEIILFAEYKGVLPAPIGTKINVIEY